MKIGIVIAIVRELQAFLDAEYEVEIIKEHHKEVYKTMVGKNEVYAIKSGYGMVDAAAATQHLITRYDVDVILNFGVTGALIPGLKVDDLFVVKKAINVDYDVSPIDPVKPHQYEEYADEFIPLDQHLLDFVKNQGFKLQEAICSTGDWFVDKRADKERLAGYGCMICDMEIAAIARTCLNNGVACLSIKCISDSLEGSGTDFNANVTNSAAKAFEIVDRILKNL